MTDALRPNPLALPLHPDPELPREGPAEAPPVDEQPDPIDDPVVWPGGSPDAPDDTGGGSLDLPGDAPDPLQPRLDPQPA